MLNSRELVELTMEVEESGVVPAIEIKTVKDFLWLCKAMDFQRQRKGQAPNRVSVQVPTSVVSRKFLAQTERTKKRVCNALEVPSLQIYLRDGARGGTFPVTRPGTKGLAHLLSDCNH